jgi:hypothetical protein
VEVIRYPQTVWSWEFICTGCDAELRALPEDLKYRETRGIWDGPTGYYYVVCPFCDTQATYIENLPLLVRRAAQERRAQ